MKIENKVLVDELIVILDDSISAAKKFKDLPIDQLNFKKNPESWSVLECLEHLNLYGDYYLPEIEHQMINNKIGSTSQLFKTGVFGNYFANLMRGKNGKIKKMKTFKDKDPIHSNLTLMTIDRFIKQLELLKSLLNQARNLDLKRIKTSISISKLIKLRLGDTFRFLIFHIERHVKQAENVLRK